MNTNDTFNRFISSELNHSDYVFIDPPQNHNNIRSSNGFWEGVSFPDLFQRINTNYIFLYCGIGTLPLVMNSFIESSFDLVALIPYVKVGKSEDTLYSLRRHSFRYPIEYIAVFQKPGCPLLSFLSKTVIVENQNSFQRPISWETAIFNELEEKNYKGLYILPDGSIADNLANADLKVSGMHKKELF